MYSEIHVNVQRQLSEMRNGSTEKERTSLPFKLIDENIIWFLSQTRDEVQHKHITLILDFKYNTVKNRMIKFRKSQLFRELVDIKQNGSNRYYSKIPSNTDIRALVKEIKQSINLSMVLKKEAVIDLLRGMNAHFLYEFWYQNLIHYLREAGNRGLTIDELYDTIPMINAPPDLVKKVKGAIIAELKRWPLSKMKNLYEIRLFKNREYYVVTKMRNEPMELVAEYIKSGGYEPSLELTNLSRRHSTKEVHTGDTNLQVKLGKTNLRKVA
jgi:hypothetical protein